MVVGLPWVGGGTSVDHGSHTNSQDRAAGAAINRQMTDARAMPNCDGLRATGDGRRATTTGMCPSCRNQDAGVRRRFRAGMPCWAHAGACSWRMRAAACGSVQQLAGTAAGIWVGGDGGGAAGGVPAGVSSSSSRQHEQQAGRRQARAATAATTGSCGGDGSLRYIAWTRTRSQQETARVETSRARLT